MKTFIIEGIKKSAIQKQIKEIQQTEKIPEYAVFAYESVDKEIGIETIRSVISEMQQAASHNRAFIFYRFDESSIEAQNALLKLLEDHTKNDTIILITAHLNTLLPTIQSRSVFIRTADNKPADIPDQTQVLLEAVCDPHQTLGKILSMSGKVNPKTKEGERFFDNVLFFFRNKLITNPHLALPILKKTLYLRRIYQSNNLNFQSTVDQLLIFIHKQTTINIRHEPFV